MLHQLKRFGALVLLSMVSVLALACSSSEDENSAATVQKVDYATLSGWVKNAESMLVIDVRPAEDFAAGHIQDAKNVPLTSLQDSDGKVLDNGKALTDVATDKAKKLVFYCFGYGNDNLAAKTAISLGYSNVYRYEYGTAEWTKSNYLVIDYSAFKTWYDASKPFTDGKNYLIDDLPVGWYSGDDSAHPEGHIPSAVNIPIESWGDGNGPINEGKAFTDVVKDKTAKVVIYCGNMTCGKSQVGAAVAAKLGYTNVFRYQGGQKEWGEKGNTFTKGTTP